MTDSTKCKGCGRKLYDAYFIHEGNNYCDSSCVKPNLKCACGRDKASHGKTIYLGHGGHASPTGCSHYEPVIPLAQVLKAIDEEMKICRAAELKGTPQQAVAIAELMVLKRKLVA